MPPKQRASTSKKNSKKHVVEKRQRGEEAIDYSYLPPDAGDDLPANSLHCVKPIPDDLSMAVTLGISNLDSLPSIMQQFGFAMIANVMSSDDIKKIEKLYSEESLAATTSKRSSGDSPSNLIPKGCKQCVSAVRMHENVVKVFEKMLAMSTTTSLSASSVKEKLRSRLDGTDEVLFSNAQECMGEMCDEYGMVTNKDWEWPEQPQPQQSPPKQPHGYSYTGELFIWPAGYGSSTTVVWPESHTFSSSISDIPEDDEFSEVSQFNAGAVRLVVPRGALVLYDSRLLRRQWKLGPQLTIPVEVEASRDHLTTPTVDFSKK